MNRNVPGQCLHLVCHGLLLALVLIPVTGLRGQTTSDQLYFAVQRAQAALGSGESADKIRDQFLIRQLETESARGFTANPEVLQLAADRLAAGDLPGDLDEVRQALQVHLENLDSGEFTDLTEEIADLRTELQPVDLESLDAQREKVLATLSEMDELNQQELSMYGRYHLNKKLAYGPLFRELEDFEFRVGDIDADDFLQRDDETDEEFQTRLNNLDSAKQNQFNRDMNSLRNQLVRARQNFGMAWLNYENRKISAAERALYDLEKQIGAYLLVQSRSRGAFEEQLRLRKQAFVSQQGVAVNPQDRLYQAELGRWLGFLGIRNQQDGLDSAARRQFSRPNLKITVQESLANRIGGQGISQVEHVDEVIVGSRAQGYSYTSGGVNLDFVDSPYSATVRINLGGAIQSSTYTKEGPVTAYTNSGGSFQASRDVVANVGNLSIYDPQGWASISTQFLGTNCAPLVTRLANRRFSERRFRAEEVASQRARERMLGQFTEQTDSALSDGAAQLSETRTRRNDAITWFKELRGKVSELFAKNQQGESQKPYELIDPLMLPRIFVTSSDREMNIQGVLEADNRLAATTDPPASTTSVDVRVQIHESMLSNIVAPFLQNRLLENWKIRNTIDGLFGGNVELPAEPNDRPFAIRFDDGRPIQVEFEGNELGVTIYGKEFRQGSNSYDDPLNIKVRFRIVNDNGVLKLVRSSRATAEFTYDPLPGETLDVGFKSFLQDNLDDALGGDPLENAIALPPNLIPLDSIKDEEARNQLANVRLTELVMDGGWLSLGWTYGVGESAAQSPFTPGIWDRLPEIDASAASTGAPNPQQ